MKIALHCSHRVQSESLQDHQRSPLLLPCHFFLHDGRRGRGSNGCRLCLRLVPSPTRRIRIDATFASDVPLSLGGARALAAEKGKILPRYIYTSTVIAKNATITRLPMFMFAPKSKNVISRLTTKDATKSS